MSFSFLFLFFDFVFLSFNASGLLAYVRCACIQYYDGVSLHCLLSLPYYNVVSLCRSFVTKACVYLELVYIS